MWAANNDTFISSLTPANTIMSLSTSLFVSLWAQSLRIPLLTSWISFITPRPEVPQVRMPRFLFTPRIPLFTSSRHRVNDKLCGLPASPSSYYAYTHNLATLSPPSICPPWVDLSIHAFSATLCYSTSLLSAPQSSPFRIQRQLGGELM